MLAQARVKVWKSSALPPSWFKRQTPEEQIDEQVESDVRAIISQVVKNGDAALIELTEKFDKARLGAKNLRVIEQEIEEGRGDY